MNEWEQNLSHGHWTFKTTFYLGLIGVVRCGWISFIKCASVDKERENYHVQQSHFGETPFVLSHALYKYVIITGQWIISSWLDTSCPCLVDFEH